MNFKEFEEKTIEYLNEQYEGEAEVSVKDVIKNNGIILRGITICFKGVNISPTIYLNDLYRDYERGDSFEEVCAQMKKMIDDAAVRDDVDISFIKSYEDMKERVLCKLINTEKNRDYLENVPHVDFLDLSVVFYTIISDNAFGSGTIVITNDYFKAWNIPVETLFEDAKENTRCLLGGNITYIEDVIVSLLNERHNAFGKDDFKELFKENEGPDKLPMYVLTNRVKTLGASCILDSERLYDFSEELDSDLFILPCSVHETILLPTNMGYDPEVLSGMVREINDSEVSKTDYLSDSVYRFSRLSGLVELA
ncbi:MAG: hypothetical protein J6U37_02225 [Lachnospiraceae bacterium]|nr:hypothetical protein [Lachnospiraceae bacterium]